MKKLILSLSLLLFASLLHAQVPQGMSYQAVARDANGECLSDATISVQFTVHDSSAVGPIAYQEEHIGLLTNEQGLFSLIIGADTNLATAVGQVDDFSELYWNNQNRWLEISLDVSGGTSFVSLGTQQLLTVPYALSAGNGLQLSEANQDEFLRWHGGNGNINGLIGGSGAGLNNGILKLYNSGGEERVRMYSLLNGSDEYGNLTLYGANGSINHVLSVNSIYGRSRGAQSWRDDNGDPQVEIFIDNNNTGTIVADGANGGVKNFRMPHPNDPAKQIWYACIEGPEVAAYTRGTATLVNGVAEIRFTEDFELVVNPSTMTILTSPWSGESEGLAIVERTASGFLVQELRGGTGNYQFDWEVKGVRKGFENYEVVRKKQVDEFEEVKQR